MSELLSVFRQNLAWSAALWVLFFAAFAWLFARGAALRFGAGLLRILAAVVFSPIVFLRKAVASVVRYTAEGDGAGEQSDQYLLNRLMTILQAALIVIAIGALAAGLVATWNAFLPPAYLREALKGTRAELASRRLELQEATRQFEALEAAWKAQEASVLNGYRTARNAVITAAVRENADIAAEVVQSGNAYASATLASMERRAAEDRYDINATRRAMDWDLNASYYSIGDGMRARLTTWADNWARRAYAARDLTNVPIDDLRRGKQPDFEQVRGRQTALEATVTSLGDRVESLRAQTKFRWRGALLRAVGVAVSFLAFVWCFGLLIEGAWLAIRIAGDVRAIREATAQRQPQHPPQPVAPAVEQTLEVPAPRLPVRAEPRSTIQAL